MKFSNESLQPELIDEACNLVGPSIAAFLQSKWPKRAVVCIYVPYGKDGQESKEFLIGDLPEEQWSAPYREIAMAKATLSAEYSRDTRDIISRFPHVIMGADIKYPGGICFEGIVVGVSGVESHFDEMIGVWFAAAIRAVARHLLNKQEEGRDTEHYFDRSPGEAPGEQPESDEEKAE